MKNHYKTIPLNDEEKEHLMFIFRKRLRLFLPTHLILLFMAAYMSYSTGYFLIAFCFLGTPLLLIGAWIFRRRMYTYWRDVKNGYKELIPFEILEKEYFLLPGRYYFRIDDPSNMHYEVDAALFYAYNEGDVIYTARAPMSKYTFEYGGRYTVV